MLLKDLKVNYLDVQLTRIKHVAVLFLVSSLYILYRALEWDVTLTASQWLTGLRRHFPCCVCADEIRKYVQKRYWR